MHCPSLTLGRGQPGRTDGLFVATPMARDSHTQKALLQPPGTFTEATKEFQVDMNSVVRHVIAPRAVEAAG